MLEPKYFLTVNMVDWYGMVEVTVDQIVYRIKGLLQRIVI